MTDNKHYSSVNLFIRSCLFLVYGITSIFIYSFVMLFSILLLPLSTRFMLIRFFFRSYLTMLRVICHIDCKIEGLENIPKDRNGVVLCKHQSTWETFMMPLIFDKYVVIAKRELLWIPFFGWGLAASNPITINRSNKSSSMQQILVKGKKCLEAGRWVLLYPEGTRIATGEVGHYKLGGTRLAVSSGYPVLPIAHNAGRYWPRRKFIKQPGTIRMVIGPLIESQDRTPEDLMAQVKDWIETKMLEIDK